MRLSPWLLLASALVPGLPASAQQAASVRPFAQPLPAPAAPPVDFSKDHVLYVIGYSHLDTEWCWSYPQVIREFIPNTLHQNFDLFKKYPDYTFNWTGSNRYKLMKEYYPDDYETLKSYIKAGRWFPNGSNVEEGDVDMPSEESVIRQVLYGNQFFRREFGVASDEFMIPDCFGFPASLPSIFAHCGLTGFSTQKLTWGSAIGIPFNVGVWSGPDGRSVIAALNPGAYVSGISDDLSHDAEWTRRVEEDGKKSGSFVDYRYYGTGDRGGAPGEDSVRWMERSLAGGGPLQVRAGKANEMFDRFTPAQRAGLPRYQGDILLTQHSTGSLTSQAAMKRWNRKNEELADAAERASVASDWLGAAPYDRARLSDAWLRFLPGQFHDLMAGTALPQSYGYAWNDQILASNEFAGVLTEAAGGVARGLDTRAVGVPLVVYNPLSVSRRDVVQADVTFPGAAPRSARVFGPDGRETPSQVVGRTASSLTLLFLARVPSVGFAAFDVRPAAAPAPADPTLRVTTSMVENARYRVTLDVHGDIAQVYDKAARRGMLSAPARLAFLHEDPTAFPAWNMDWNDQKQPPQAYVGGPASVRVVEKGPARVALQITRHTNGSTFTQTIRLTPGGDRVEIANAIDWKSQECALKAVFPLSVANPEATYNWELGTIKRGNDDPKKYEVPSHRWFDLTDTGGRYGVSVLDDCKYGSDKPSDNTLRLTLLYTPGVQGGYEHQGTQDWGRHEFVYALKGHAGGWQQGGTQWDAARLNQPLLAFQTPPHAGGLGRTFSLASVSSPQVSVEALKKAEDTGETIVRINELSGLPATNVRLALAAPILSVREVDGQERTVGADSLAPATLRGGQLVFSTTPYRPRAFALTLGRAPARLAAPRSVPLPLPYNLAVASSAPGKKDGDFDGHGDALPAELLPATLDSNGVTFRLGPRAPGAKNAVACAGQTLALPPGAHRRVLLLASAAGADTPATFTLGGRAITRTIQGWGGDVAQWDTRLWKGKVAELTYDWPNPIAGLTPGYIKRAPVAWYADHRRLADGTNDPYAFCYLFRYSLDVPDGARTLRLPDNAAVRVMAATVSFDPNADARPAQPLYDVLDRTGGSTARITRAGGPRTAALVTVEPPLFFAGDLHYTLDGTTPSLTSPVYTAPFFLPRTADVTAATVAADGQAGRVRTVRVEVNDVAPPSVLSASALPGGRAISALFSEPVDPATAQDPARYRPEGGAAVRTATLAPDGRTVLLTLGAPLPDAGPARLSVAGVRDLSPAGSPTSPGASVPITVTRPAFTAGPVQAFTGIDGFQRAGLSGLPVAATDPWTINLFVSTGQQPGELTTLGGFGDATDTAGQQRYLIKFHDSIHFWGGGVDINSGVPYDLNKWQMVSATFDGRTVRLYKNGQEIKSATASFNAAQPAARLAPPSAWPNGHRFSGQIRDFTVWSTALPPTDLQALWAQGQGK